MVVDSGLPIIIKQDILHWTEYDFVVINDDLDNCYSQIINFINLKRQNKEIKYYDIELIKKHIEILLN